MHQHTDVPGRPAPSALARLDDAAALALIRSLPSHFAAPAHGDCLEPAFSAGMILVMSTEDRPRRGYFVAIWLTEAGAARHGERHIVKRLVCGWEHLAYPRAAAPAGQLEPIVLVEMLNPQRGMALRASEILAMHKVVGTAGEAGPGRALWQQEAGNA